MDKENVQHLNDQVKYMGFNEGQLKRTGFGEAFTPELKTKMETRHTADTTRLQKKL